MKRYVYAVLILGCSGLAVSCAAGPLSSTSVTVQELLASPQFPKTHVTLHACVEIHRHGINLKDCTQSGEAIALQIPAEIESRPDISAFLAETYKTWNGRKKLRIEADFTGVYEQRVGAIPSRVFILDRIREMRSSDY